MIRDEMHERLRWDILGPASPTERLKGRPTDIYLTGILWSNGSVCGAEEDEGMSAGDGHGKEDDGAAETAGLRQSKKPSVCGLSFAMSGDRPIVDIAFRYGTYRPSPATPGEWERQHHEDILPNLEVDTEGKAVVKDLCKMPKMERHSGLEITIRGVRHDGHWIVTVVLSNRRLLDEAIPSRDRRDAAAVFQAELTIRPGHGCKLIARPDTTFGTDPEQESMALVYRDSQQYATGHGCSVRWAEHGPVHELTTDWIPAWRVKTVSAQGASVLRPLSEGGESAPLSAAWLAEAPDADLVKALRLVPELYRGWVNDLIDNKIPTLDSKLQPVAERHMQDCTSVADRIAEAIDLIDTCEPVRKAFRFANKAIDFQRTWGDPAKPHLFWRPFQLAWFLLALPSTWSRDHRDRELMDLIWFPTGGGKTEAYLGLIAFILSARRLRPEGNEAGAGTGVIMRYTMRALTAQQFQRAAALILACEHLRRRPDGAVFGPRPFSIGLWVGGDATPNDIKELRDFGNKWRNAHNGPCQLRQCPACGEILAWNTIPQDVQRATTVSVNCSTAGCVIHKLGELPVLTIDELLYANPPSLVVGTVDKFAQLVRNHGSGRLLGRRTPHSPPDLILQDELHLITGPLGTLFGIYELGIDWLCRKEGRPPKVIGSTATIRKAEEQVQALFQRRVRLFPPQAIDAGESCFSSIDHQAPGRLYVGVSTIGRSAKFTLQAASASLLQSFRGIPAAVGEATQAYGTQLLYFNTIRELGGSVVMLQDDVHATLRVLADRHKENARSIHPPEELTSRRTQAEIVELLESLKSRVDDAGGIDAVLATNMVSVGIDITRLSVMLLNGMPKTVAEYIQASSRVGRSAELPGVVVVLFNHAKPRDRSRFESFRTWHEALYRGVEAASVTPFASRARDRALHAPFLMQGLQSAPTPGPPAPCPVSMGQWNQELRQFADRVLQSVTDTDRREIPGTTTAIDNVANRWEGRAGPDSQWWPTVITSSGAVIQGRLAHAVNIGLEDKIHLAATGEGIVGPFATPNSLRTVDAGCTIRIL